MHTCGRALPLASSRFASFAASDAALAVRRALNTRRKDSSAVIMLVVEMRIKGERVLVDRVIVQQSATCCEIPALAFERTFDGAVAIMKYVYRIPAAVSCRKTMPHSLDFASPTAGTLKRLRSGSIFCPTCTSRYEGVACNDGSGRARICNSFFWGKVKLSELVKCFVDR
eukprot:IDg15549t1